MSTEDECELVWANPKELEAAHYLTNLYNQLLTNQGATPEAAFNIMLQQMQDENQLAMLYKWDHAGRMVG